MGLTLGIVTSVDHTHYIPLSNGLWLRVEVGILEVLLCVHGLPSAFGRPHMPVSQRGSPFMFLPFRLWGGCSRLIVEVGQLSVVWILL